MKRISSTAITLVLTLSMLISCNKSAKPTTADELLDLGEKYLLDLDYEQALVQFLDAIEIEPMNPRGYTGAAEAYVGQERYNRAMSVLQKGVNRLSDSRRFLRDAAEIYEDIIDKDPLNPDAYIELAEIYLMLGNNESADRVLQSGNEQLPDNADILDMISGSGRSSPGTSGASEAPTQSAAPWVPASPGMPGSSGSSSTPEQSSAPGMPGSSGSSSSTPEQSAAPGASASPDMPGPPGATSSPGAPALPGVTASQAPSPSYEAPPPEASPVQPGNSENSVSNFSIEGTWKSVGSEGFGQAQPGAIVAFDGTHCNYYSPYDTYAFYKSGDNYQLDVTSFIFAENLSFTVKVINQNRVEIYYGSTPTVLDRVD